MTRKLNYINYLNIITYLINVIATLAIGGGDYSIDEDGETMITTPAWSSVIMWGLIYIAEGIYAYTQLKPRYRGSPIVQEGVANWFIGINLLQVFFIQSYTTDIYIFCAVSMFMVNLFLLCVNMNLEDIPPIFHPRVDFWIFRFPFHLHKGWVYVQLQVAINATISDVEVSTEALEYLTGISLAVILYEGIHQLFFKRPTFVIPAVLVYSTFALAIWLSSPSDEVDDSFSSSKISQYCMASYVIMFTILGLMGIKFVQVKRDGYELPGDDSSIMDDYSDIIPYGMEEDLLSIQSEDS